MSFQMFAVSAMAMFALLFNEYKNSLQLEDPNFSEEGSKEAKNEKQCDATKIYVMRPAFVCVKRRN